MRLELRSCGLSAVCASDAQGPCTFSPSDIVILHSTCGARSVGRFNLIVGHAPCINRSTPLAALVVTRPGLRFHQNTADSTASCSLTHTGGNQQPEETPSVRPSAQNITCQRQHQSPLLALPLVSSPARAAQDRCT